MSGRADEPIYSWTWVRGPADATCDPGIELVKKFDNGEAIYSVPIPLSRALEIGLVPTRERGLAKIHAREALAEPWCAALLRDNPGLKSSLEGGMEELLANGATAADVKARTEAAVALARATLDTIHFDERPGVVTRADVLSQTVRDLLHGMPPERAREEAEQHALDPEAYFAGNWNSLRDSVRLDGRDLRLQNETLQADPHFAAVVARTCAADAIAEEDPTSYHYAALRWFFDKEEGSGDLDHLAREARDQRPEWRDRFARRVMERAREAFRIITEAPAPASREEATRVVETEHGAVLWANAELAALVEKIGPKGKEAADEILAASAEKFRELDAQRSLDFAESTWGTLWRLWNPPEKHLWNDSGPLFLRYLVQVVWRDEIHPAIEREVRNPPSLVLTIHEDVSRVHSRLVKVEDVNGQRAIVFDDADPMLLVPSVAEEATQALVERGVDLLGTVTAHRALRWEVTTGHERAMRGEADARVLRIDGGWSVFANEVLGLKSKAEADRLKAIVYAQDAVQITLPDGSRGRMLNLREWAAQGQRRGRIEIMLGTMLLPHYVHELGERIPKGRKLSEARRLIPVCDLPPFVGRPNDHGPQATLSMLVVRELRANARELVESGAVHIPLQRWGELARKAGLPRVLLGKVLDRWTQDGPDAPAFLTRSGPDAYTLAKTYTRELAFILDGARREVSGSHAGRRSVSARAAKMRRLARGGE